MPSAVMRGEQIRSVPHLAGVALTVVERRIMALTAAGLTLTQIGFELGMSETTARHCRDRIYEKLGARNAAHAVAIWLGREALDHLIEDARRPD